MPTFEELRHTIATATDLKSVVTTMKTFAAVSIRQYERAAEALSHYNQTIEMGFQIVLQHASHLAASRELPGKTGVVVFGTDQGMCGQFNEEIVSFARSQQQQDPNPTSWLWMAIGARIEGLLQERGLTLEHTYRVPTSVSDISNLVQELLPHIQQWRETAHVTRLLVFHNQRISGASYHPQGLQLWPMDPARFREWSTRPWNSRSLPTFVTPARQLLSQLVQQYLFVALFRACTESLASENASRIAAMQAAEKNIEERLEELQRLHHHLRQSTITEELLDVLTGFEALARPKQNRASTPQPSDHR